DRVESRKKEKGPSLCSGSALGHPCASNRFAYGFGLRAARHAANAKTAATADRIAATDALDIANRPPLDCSEDSCWFAVPAFVLIVATSPWMVVIFPFSDSKVAVTVPSDVWTVAALPGKVYVALYRPTATSVATNACEVPLGPQRFVSIVAARMVPCPVTRT